MTEQERQSIIDEQQLWLLSLGHYISGAMTIVFSSFFVLHLLMFTLIMNVPEIAQDMEANADPNMPDVLGVFRIFFGTIAFLGISFGIAEILAGFFIKDRKHRAFTLIVAVPRIMMIPYGSLLTVFTFIILERSSVKDLYNKDRTGDDEA